jgi:hypothetical protein
MKTPPPAYQKLFDSVLLGDFSEIESISVAKKWLLGTMLGVDIYLKKPEEIKSMVSSKALLRRLEKRISELNEYFGESGVIVINIYFEGELLIHDAFRL